MYIRLFEGTDDRYNPFVPFILLPFVIAGILYNWGETPVERLILNSSAAIFLVSTLLLGFTWANMIALPEYRHLIRLKTDGKPIRLWRK